LNFPNLPIKFFGTGEVIPEDIEAASPERLLAGIFRIE
jgi:flagellar biosynthesis GTPase FlhF